MSGGYATVDRAAVLNGDRFVRGRRGFVEGRYTLTPEVTLSTFFTRAFRNDFAVPNRTRLDVVVTYNVLKGLQRGGVWRYRWALIRIMCACSDEILARADSRFRRLDWAHGRSAATCGAGRMTRRASRRFMRRSIMASTGSTRRPIYGSGHSEEVVGRAVKQLGSGKRPLIFTKFGLGARQRHAESFGGRGRRRGRMRREPAAARRRSHRSVSAALAGAAADRRNRGGVRRAAEGREDSRDRRLELLGGAARRVDRDRRAAAQRSAAVQHPAPGGEARRPALVRRAQRRRHLLLAAVPRPAVRHVVEGQDLPRGRRPQHAQGLRGARFQRHLQAIDEIRALATSSGLSVPQLCVGVLLQTPGLTGVIVGARSARQGGSIAGLGVSITSDQAAAVWAIADRLAKDLESLQ